MIPKSGYRLSEKIMLKQQAKAKWRFEVIAFRFNVACPDSVKFSREFQCSAAIPLRCGNKRWERLANRGQNAPRGKFSHIEMRCEPADRLVAWPAFDFVF